MSNEEVSVRRRLLRLATKYPGLHLRELARQADISEALAGYHLDALVEEGALQRREESSYHRFYATQAAAPAEHDRGLMAILRQEIPLRMALHLLDSGRATNQELVPVLSLAKSTVSYHTSRLLKAGFLVEADGGGVALRDPKRVRSLLVRWEPPDSLTKRFTRLWTDMFGAGRRRR